MWKRQHTQQQHANQPHYPERAELVPIGRGGPAALVPVAEPSIDIGRSVVLRGEVTASEDLRVDGVIEGRIELAHGELTIGSHARITAPIVARRVQIGGSVVGDVRATEAVVIVSTGSLRGDITAPRVEIADGAYFRGRIDMSAALASQAEPQRIAV